MTALLAAERRFPARRKDRDVTRDWKLLAALVTILALTLGTAACGGDSDEDDGDGDRPAAEETKDTDEDADDDANGASGEDGENGDDGDDDETVDPASSLSGLESYRFALNMEMEGLDTGLSGDVITIDVEGAFVAPDRTQAKCWGKIGPVTFEEETIRIGADSWVRSDGTGGRFVEGEADFCSDDFSAASLLEAFEGAPLRGIKGTSDEVNGVDATRYSFDQETLKEMERLARVFGGGFDGSDLPEDMEFDMDIWLAKDGGWPVKLVLNMTGFDAGVEMAVRLTADIADVNEDIEIEAP